MATTIENKYVGDGTTVLYSFTFPYINESDVRVSLNSLPTTEYSLANPTTVQLNTAPAVGVAIRVYRVTDVDAPEATFFPGSVIRASDLNDNFVQTIYATQESAAYIEDSDAAQVKGTADEALAKADAALAVAEDAQETADGLEAEVDNAVDLANAAVPRTSLTGSAIIPVGSTGERDGFPQEGYLRYNTVTDQFEGYTNLGWSSVGGDGGVSSIIAGDGIAVDQATGDVTITNTGGDDGSTPIGSIVIWANSAVPTGWLECDGSPIPAEYTALIALVGANTPDLRGEFVRGWDNGRGVDTGRALGSTQDDEFESHNHSVPIGNVNQGGPGSGIQSNNNGSVSSGSAGGDETRPRNVALMYIIRY